MARAFPADEPFLNGYYAPLSMESDAFDLPVTGAVPRELHGSLYRIGPNPQFAPRGKYDWFVADGMAHAFHIENGRVAYRNRWVRTPKWEMEHAHGESLHSGSMGPSPLTDPRLTELNSTLANTNVVWHGGRLLALEEAHAPFELDPVTLASKGLHTYGGQLQGPMTAHPKLDPVTGEWISFGYGTRGPFSPDMMFHVVGPDGQLRRAESFKAPFASMVHDFCVTRSHVVFPIFPLAASLERARAGRPPFAWEPERGNHIGIMRRDGSTADIRWFTGNASYVFHPMNAYDTDDGKLVCDMMRYAAPTGFRMADGSPTPVADRAARLVRWTFNLGGAGGGYTEEPLCEISGEFPRLDERFALQPYHHGYFRSGSIGDAVAERRDFRTGVAALDLRTGHTSLWQPRLGDYCSEPVFVPRSADAAEGDGFLLCTIYRGQENRSDLAVFEARDVERGPVALVHLSHRVPAGFHGNWRQGS